VCFVFVLNNHNPRALLKGIYYKPNGELSFWPLVSIVFLSRMLIFLQFTNVTRKQNAAPGILLLGEQKRKENLNAVLY
jgi:hypothetical protein